MHTTRVSSLRAAIAPSLVAALVAAVVAAFGCASDDAPNAPLTGPLAGRIEDAFGDPVANATVVAWSLAGSTTPMPTDTSQIAPGFAVLERETDASGRYDFGTITAGAWVVAAAFGGGLAAADTVSVPDLSADLRLDPASALRGRVQLGGVSGAGGVRVNAPLPGAETVSELDGTWLLPGVPAGRWPVRFSMDGFRDTIVTAPRVAAGDTADVADVTLVPRAGPAPR